VLGSIDGPRGQQFTALLFDDMGARLGLSGVPVPDPNGSPPEFGATSGMICRIDPVPEDGLIGLEGDCLDLDVYGDGNLDGLTSLPSAAAAENFLEIEFIKLSDDANGFYYEVDFETNKVGATTCEVITGSGLYACSDPSGMGQGFVPDPNFFRDHVNLTYNDFLDTISAGWRLTWDAGLATETVANISFEDVGSLGMIDANDFLAVPVITNPLNGTSDLSPHTRIDWTYAGLTDPNDAWLFQLDVVDVELFGPSGASRDSDELDLGTLSWTPADPLTPGSWLAEVSNAFDPGLVADGTGGPITGDPWVLDNTDWLDLQSVDRSQFAVVSGPSGIWVDLEIKKVAKSIPFDLLEHMCSFSVSCGDLNPDYCGEDVLESCGDAYFFNVWGGLSHDVEIVDATLTTPASQQFPFSPCEPAEMCMDILYPCFDALQEDFPSGDYTVEIVYADPNNEPNLLQQTLPPYDLSSLADLAPLSIVEIDPNGLTLSWSTVPGVAEYEFYAWCDPG
jgi:hypothetical protein